MKKYKLVKEEYRYYVKSTKIFRLRALRDIGNYVKKGDLGGYVESELNLSHEGDCWIYNDALVHGHARVSMDAGVYDRVIIYGEAKIYGEATISDDCQIRDKVEVGGNAIVYGDVLLEGKFKLLGNIQYWREL